MPRLGRYGCLHSSSPLQPAHSAPVSSLSNRGSKPRNRGLEADRRVIGDLILDGLNPDSLPSPTVMADRAIWRGNDTSNGNAGSSSWSAGTSSAMPPARPSRGTGSTTAGGSRPRIWVTAELGLSFATSALGPNRVPLLFGIAAEQRESRRQAMASEPRQYPPRARTRRLHRARL